MKTPRQCIVVFDMIMLRGVFVLLLFLCRPSIAIVIKAYKANPLHDDKLFNDSLLLEVPSNSLGSCNSICGPNCIYFGFNFKQEKCRVHYTTELTNAEMEAEWRYYAPYEPNYRSKDCLGVFRTGQNRSGVFRIYPAGGVSTDVICDMETMGGGWTVIQNRFNGSENFNRNWNDYKSGFGSTPGEYWIGNDVIHELTKANTSSLYVTLTLTNGTTLFELYEAFSIASELDNYRLFIGGQASGTLGNQVTGSIDSGSNLNGMMFSTLDRNNDKCGSYHCASLYKGGWWFYCCGYAFLNGLYNMSSWWNPWYPTVSTGTMLQKTSMMIRRR